MVGSLELVEHIPHIVLLPNVDRQREPCELQVECEDYGQQFLQVHWGKGGGEDLLLVKCVAEVLQVLQQHVVY